MNPQLESENLNYNAVEKFTNKIVIVTGGDSGIGKATAILFAKEGASVAVIYLSEDEDASYITGQTLHVNGGTIVNG